jgi:hypothetical protein
MSFPEGDTPSTHTTDTPTAEPTDTQPSSAADHPPETKASTTPTETTSTSDTTETTSDTTETTATNSTPKTNIYPHNLADNLPIDVATETVNAWATGDSLPDTDSEAWAHICLYLEDEHPEAATAVESPSDLPTIIGNGRAQSQSQSRSTTNSENDPPNDQSGSTSLTF